MSGIYGMFRFDGAPVEAGTLRQMRQSMAYYGPDGGGDWLDGPVGLGQLQLHVAAEDRFEVQPLTISGVTLVAAARLDNRDELLREFSIPAAAHGTIPDSRLLLEAYLKWGEDCPDRLNGDWQFALWDSRRRSLFVARDHHGTTGLCYHHHPRFLAFASSIKGLLALAEAPRKHDILRLAEILSISFGDGYRTAYEGLLRLPPAHILHVTETRAVKRRYWHPENLSLLHIPSEREHIAQFLDLYSQAVRCRLRSERPVGATLSGGLDSGSVAALAAPMLAAEGRKLIAFTSAPCFAAAISNEHHFGDEWHFAEATAKRAGNVMHLPIRCIGSSVLAGIEKQLEISGEPYFNSLNYYWITDLLEQARIRKVGALLTGQNGNATVSYAGAGELFPYLMRGDFKHAINAFNLAEPNSWLAVKRAILRPVLLPLLQGLGVYRRPEQFRAGDYVPINPHFAKSIGLKEHLRRIDDKAAQARMPSRLSGKKHQIEVLNPGSCLSGAFWQPFGAWYGMEVRDPTGDRRIIEFCLQTPDYMFRRHGESRWLLRQAMSGRMPPEVLACRERGLQAADVCSRVLDERNEIKAVIARLAHHPMANDFLDLPKMKDVLSRLEKDPTRDAMDQCSMILLNGLSIGLFLSRF